MHKTMVRHEQKIGTNKVTYYRSTPDSPHQIFISNKVFGEHHMYLTNEQLKDLAKFLCHVYRDYPLARTVSCVE